MVQCVWVGAPTSWQESERERIQVSINGDGSSSSSHGSGSNGSCGGSIGCCEGRLSGTVVPVNRIPLVCSPSQDCMHVLETTRDHSMFLTVKGDGKDELVQVCSSWKNKQETDFASNDLSSTLGDADMS
jgi:hypothetical protein